MTASDGVLASSGSFVLTVVPAGQAAVFDDTLLAPKCGAIGSSCQSGALLVGRATMTGGNEPHGSNTINAMCSDGTLGAVGFAGFHSDESIDAIKVSTVDGSAFAANKAGSWPFNRRASIWSVRIRTP